MTTEWNRDATETEELLAMTAAKDERLTEVGTAAMASIREMVAALQCDYDRMIDLRDERATCPNTDDDGNQVSETWEQGNPHDAAELAALEAAAGGCTEREDAETIIHEDALSVEVRSDWTSLGEPLKAGEYCLLLSTGGPATRIVGDLDGGQPTSARLEVSDWGTPWTVHPTTHTDDAYLLAYANCFYFGE